ncbi:MAG: MMPL family transporter [Alphaproteobacteria bacterium]|nr:MMPL family transporter [Alphaproteobacteria bacterium]
MADWQQPHWSGRPQTADDPRPRLRPNAYARLARFCAGNAPGVLGLYLVLALGAATLAAVALSVEPDSLPRLTVDELTAAVQADLAEQFPDIDETIYGVVSNANSAAARQTAVQLAEALETRGDLFTSAFVPGTGAFYDRYGFLFRSSEDIAARVALVTQMQPLYHALAAAPDLQALAALVSEIGRAVEQGRSPPGLEGLLLAVADTVEAEIKGEVRPVNWPRLAGLDSEVSSQRWFVIATPVTGKERQASLLARSISGAHTDILWLWPRSALASPANPLRDFLVPAGLAILVSFTLLVAGLGSLRHAVPVILATGVTASLAAGAAVLINPVLDGVTWSFALAALAPSILLATVLVISHAEARHRGAGLRQAIMLSAHRRGGVLAGFAMIFIAFWLSWMMRQLPSLTQFGIVAIVSALIALLVALTLVPAALALFDNDGKPVDSHWFDIAVSRGPSTNLQNAVQVFGMLIVAAGVFSGVFLPGTRLGERIAGFSPPPILDTPDARGAIHVLTTPDTAKELIASLSTLPEVGAIRWVGQFLPLDAGAKIATLRQIEGLMPGLPAPRTLDDQTAVSATFAELETGLRKIADNPVTDTGLRDAAHRLRRTISLLANPELPSPGRVLALEEALFAGLGQLSRVAEQLVNLRPPALDDLEPGLRRRFISDAGRWRIEVMPKPDVGVLSFAAAVRRVVPSAAGEPVMALARNEVMHHETGIALAAALAAATVMAFAVLRRPVRWLMVLPATAFFYTFSAAAVAELGLALNTAMLTALSTISALAISSAILVAERHPRRRGDPVNRPIAAFRAALLPPLVLAGAVAPLMISSIQPVALFGTMASLLLAVALLVNALLLPCLAIWLARAAGD